MNNDAPIRLVQVSDTHLSPSHGYFAGNFAAFRAAMRAAPPDLIVHSGDLAFNGPAAPEDLRYGAAAMAALGVPWLAIPGNHDIGEAPRFARLEQPLTAARMAAWRQHVGPQWWRRDLGAWRVIGLDSALMASGLPEEAEQQGFLAEALATRQDRPVMVFTHMPPFADDPEDRGFTTSSLPYEARRAFLDACADGGVKVIACGHLHLYRTLRHRGMAIVWAPATAMVSARRGLEMDGHLPRPGYLEWALEGRAARHRLVQPQRMFVIDMTGWTAANGGTTTTLPPMPDPAELLGA
ncbi:hypothetical protein E0493_04140 [Roseomonas sp. M0104]|uniref:Calcineurin-like phosphoesterase domain-containing protein n=1 Tax=Teichococcus coralli TaxID=2545983 RepID=A0A845B4G0_9PROT|nr:metallophosphoesterase [Pseudoroseomonas coralli]MXP62543.1 hypothetical protein [Pseudoroseomonas coralli]